MKWLLNMRRSLMIALAALVMLTAKSGIILAKVGFESFTQAQQDWLWRQVDDYARFEAFLKFCGRGSNFEQRIAAAAEKCATAEAMQKVRAVFRRKVAQYTHLNKPGICQMPGSPELLTKIGRSMDSAIEDVRRACNTCTIC